MKSFGATINDSSRSAPPGPHPEPEQLERIVNGEGSEPERLALLEHVLRCPTCGPELDLLRAASEGARAAHRRMPAARWLALAAAAILVIGLGAVVLRGRRIAPSDDVMRGHSAAISLIEPASGAVLAVTRSAHVARGQTVRPAIVSSCSPPREI